MPTSEKVIRVDDRMSSGSRSTGGMTEKSLHIQNVLTTGAQHKSMVKSMYKRRIPKNASYYVIVKQRGGVYYQE